MQLPATLVEVWLTTISMFLGASMFAGIVGSITAVLLNIESPSAKYDALVLDVRTRVETKPSNRTE